MDLLEHEMGIAAFFCRFYVPFNGHGFTLYWCPVNLTHRNSTRTQRHDFTLIHDKHTACVFKNGWDIGRQELLALSNANNQWPTTQTSTNQHIWLLRTDNSNSIGACDALQSETHRLLKIISGFTEVIALNQVREHFGIRLRAKGVSFML